MAKLDKLLKAVVDNGMDCLVLDPGRLPRLQRGTSEHEVTQTRLDEAVILRLVTELAPPGFFDIDTAGGERRFEYQHDSALFELVVQGEGHGYATRATPRQAGGDEAAAAPAATATATSGVSSPITSVAALLEEMLVRDASDLHLSAGQPPRFRVQGELRALGGYEAPTTDDLQRLLWEITPGRNREQFDAENDTDFAFEGSGKTRFRLNVFRDRLGVGCVARAIPEQIPTAEQLGLPEVLQKVQHLSKGLVLVTGPTGSGKSTSLAALLGLINRTRHDHIITIEDPIEFVHRSQGCLVNQREVGVHTGSFKNALRAALREDPDVILVGEMRDLETVSIAIETAETGHLVFGTLHTTSAASTVERLVDQFPGDRQGQIRMMLAESLFAVVSQVLLKRREGGRVAAFEVMVATPAVSNLIREGKTFQIPSAMQTGRAQGMIQLNESLLALVKQGLVDPGEAYLKANDQDDLAARLKSAGIRLELPTSGS